MQSSILFVVNNLDFFISHRLNIAKEAKKNGFKVHLAVEKRKNDFEKIELLKDFYVHNYFISRSSQNIFYEIYTFLSLYKLIRKVNPKIIHLITIKPIIYGGIISNFLNIPFKVISVTGMGYVFINKKKIKIKILKYLIVKILKISLNHNNQKIIFQNKSDINEFSKITKINKNNIILIPGSGVDLILFKNLPENPKNNLVIMVSRLLKDKGIFEFIEASNIIIKKNLKARFWVIGELDNSNPASLTKEDVKYLKRNSRVRFFGFRKDIHRLYSYSNIAVLPSYREGFPKSLIEASASGRPIITTNVPGCRDAIIDNETGILVKARDSFELSFAIEKLLNNKFLRTKMGNKGRIHAEKTFNISEVVNQHMKIYNAFFN